MGKSFGYEKLAQYFFKSQAICLDYSKKKEKIVVGLDNGNIVCIDYNHDSEKNIKVVFDRQIQKKRIMGVSVDHKRNCVYSISEDKSFASCNLESGLIEGSK